MHVKRLTCPQLPFLLALSLLAFSACKKRTNNEDRSTPAGPATEASQKTPPTTTENSSDDFVDLGEVSDESHGELFDDPQNPLSLAGQTPALPDDALVDEPEDLERTRTVQSFSQPGFQRVTERLQSFCSPRASRAQDALGRNGSRSEIDDCLSDWSVNNPITKGNAPQPGAVFHVFRLRSCVPNTASVNPITGNKICKLMGLNDAEQLAVKTFQGLANQNGARVYIIESEGDNSETLLKALQRRYPQGIYTWKEPRPASEIFTEPLLADVPRKMVIYNAGSNRILINNALTVAAAKGAVVAEASVVPWLTKSGFIPLDGEFGDLRRFSSSGNPTQMAQASEAWTFNNLWPLVNHKLFGMGIGALRNVNAFSRGADYLVANRLYTVFVCADLNFCTVDTKSRSPANVVNTIALQRKILSKFPPFTMGVGFWAKEYPDITFLTKYQLVNMGDSYNQSFLQHLRTLNELPIPPKSRELKYNKDKTNVTLLVTQGGYAYVHNQVRTLLSARSSRNNAQLLAERVPMTIMSPGLQADTQFAVGDDVVSELRGLRGKVTSSLGDRGAGYLSELSLPPGLLKEYYLRCRAYLKRGNMRLWITNNGEYNTKEKFEGPANTIEPSAIFDIFASVEGGQGDDVPFLTTNKTPVFTDAVQVTLKEKKVKKSDGSVVTKAELNIPNTIQKIKKSAEKRQFVFVAFPWVGTDAHLGIEKLFDRTEGVKNFEVVTGEEMAQLFKESLKR